MDDFLASLQAEPVGRALIKSLFIDGSMHWNLAFAGMTGRDACDEIAPGAHWALTPSSVIPA
jgi:hypothetical protein